MKVSLLVVAVATLGASEPACPAVADGSAAGSPKLVAQFVDPNDPAVAQIRRTAESAITWLGSKMIRDVKSSVSPATPAASIASCHLKSIPTTGTPIPSMPSIKAVKRTSLRLTNPANAPDAADLEALEYVRAAIERGEVPGESVVQLVTTLDAKVEWRVYRPVAALPECLQCHGAAPAINTALVDEMRRVFPDAQATGYRAGEWRGLIRVSVAPPPGPATTAKTVKP